MTSHEKKTKQKTIKGCSPNDVTRIKRLKNTVTLYAYHKLRLFNEKWLLIKNQRWILFTIVMKSSNVFSFFFVSDSNENNGDEKLSDHKIFAEKILDSVFSESDNNNCDESLTDNKKMATENGSFGREGENG